MDNVTQPSCRRHIPEAFGAVQVLGRRPRRLDGGVRLRHDGEVRLKKEDFMSELAFEVRA